MDLEWLFSPDANTGKFHYYCYKGGKKDDIGRIKA